MRQIGVTKSWIGLSTDTKPSGTNVDIGDGFYEYDTRNSYIYRDGGWALYRENISDTPLAFWGTCGSTMTSSTTILLVPDLAGYEEDIFNNKYYLQIIYNADAPAIAPENEIRQITDYASTSGTFTVAAFSGKVNAGDKIMVVHESAVIAGRNDADNIFSSNNVASNRDGSLLERSEFIIDTLLGSLHFRSEQSKAGAVEENGRQAFNISVFDVDSGAINATAIDIASISQVMWKSDAGAAFATTGITQPVFAAANGRIYCDYQFLAAEWAVGDIYKLVIDGITVLVDSDTLYVPAMVWSNAVIEAEDLDTYVENLISSMATANASLGTITNEINLVQATLSTALSEINLTQASLSTANANILILETGLEGGTNAVNRAAGKTQYFTKEIISSSTASDVLIATTTATACNIKGLSLISNGTTSASFTSINISGGTSKVISFISAAQASLDAIDKQVTWSGNKVLRADAARGTIVADLTGTAASPVDMTIVIEYESIANGGYLA